MPVTKTDIENVLAEYPDLCREGFGLYAGWTAAEKCEKFAASRLQLLDERGIAEINRARIYLAVYAAQKKMNYVYDSYAIKHFGEPSIQHVANGAFIVAAILCGFQIERIPNSLSVWLNIDLDNVDQAFAACFGDDLLAAGKQQPNLAEGDHRTRIEILLGAKRPKRSAKGTAEQLAKLWGPIALAPAIDTVKAGVE